LWVYLDGCRIGTLTQTSRGALGFSYLGSYLGTTVPTPLSLSMPTTRVAHPHKAVHAYLEGLLPDSQDVRERWGRMYGVSARNPYALLSHVGRDAAGAVQILPPGVDSDDAASQRGDIERLSLDDLDQLLSELTRHRTDWNPGRRAGRWSLAGAQSKIALHQDPDGAWGIPLDATPTNRIVKPALAHLPDHHVNEALVQRTATQLGLPAAAVDVIETRNAHAFVAHRYDRAADSNGRMRRLHQEDLCQALAVHPSKKYQEDGGPSVGDVADLFSRLVIDDRDRNRQDFLDALAYNVLIAGTDAHAKNYSLLLASDRARLAPWYDMASLVATGEMVGVVASALKIGDHWDMRQIRARDWASVGRRLSLSADKAVERVFELRTELPAALDRAVRTLPELTHSRAERMAARIAEHADSLRR
jgi:serine/threonine-protein kinase HipA